MDIKLVITDMHNVNKKEYWISQNKNGSPKMNHGYPKVIRVMTAKKGIIYRKKTPHKYEY